MSEKKEKKEGADKKAKNQAEFLSRADCVPFTKDALACFNRHRQDAPKNPFEGYKGPAPLYLEEAALLLVQYSSFAAAGPLRDALMVWTGAEWEDANKAVHFLFRRGFLMVKRNILFCSKPGDQWLWPLEKDLKGAGRQALSP